MCVGRVYIEFHEQEGKGFNVTVSELLENRGRTKENNCLIEETHISCVFRIISMTLKSVAQSAHSISIQFSLSFASCFFCPFTMITWNDHSKLCPTKKNLRLESSRYFNQSSVQIRKKKRNKKVQSSKTAHNGNEHR